MTAWRAASPRADGGLVHEALIYRTLVEFVDGTARFVRAGLGNGDAVLVSIPGVRIAPLRAGLGRLASRVRFADMTRVGRNPARIIPFVRQFADRHPRRRISFVGEPIWLGRSTAEIRECVRHEALLNAAFAGADIRIFCPYDAAGLDTDTMVDAWRTHPVVGEGDQWQSSPDYADPAVLYAAADRPLPTPPADTILVPFTSADLALIRQLIADHAGRLGLTADRAEDLTLAVNEVVTNTVAHTRAGGTLRVWLDAGQDAVVCEVTDTGRITDLLVGRRIPSTDAEGGRGLWLVNHLCDLVELRSSEQGTTVRLYARRR
jgi:anti-sigma regulatory factor (Ser/Thr protein kinase)